MERFVGTISRGIRTPIISQGDNIVDIVCNSVLNAEKAGNFTLQDHDVVSVTEAVVARSQGNYASVDQIAQDIHQKFQTDEIGVIFPILSRNRFAVCLKGIARGVKKIYLMLSYPSDEVGNQLFDTDLLDEKGVNPWTDVLSEQKYRELFGTPKHRFTGVDYIEYYKELIQSQGCAVEVILANDARAILAYTKNVLTCDIHTRKRTERRLLNAGAQKVFTLDTIMSTPINGSGYNEQYGLLGSNKSTEEKVKLFPRDCKPVVDAIQARLIQETGKRIEVMIYGDGAFKDPIGGIWELADPVVSPAYTQGLEGQPHEIKLKYLADNDFAQLKGTDLKQAISDYIKHKEDESSDKSITNMASQGTTPRRIVDLIGSLSDLTSGSGDKGTPVVLIQGYFDNYTS